MFHSLFMSNIMHSHSQLCLLKYYSVSITGFADAYQTLSVSSRPHFIWKLMTARYLAMCDHLSWQSACLRVSELVNFRVNICSLEQLWDLINMRPCLWKSTPPSMCHTCSWHCLLDSLRSRNICWGDGRGIYGLTRSQQELFNLTQGNI